MLKQEGGDTTSSSSYLTNSWPSWCDSCRSVPCSVYCRADSAYLCSPCDASIHSANSLARRHHRVPVLPAGLFLHPDINVPIPTIQHHDGDEEDVDEYLDLVDFEEKKSKVKGGGVSESVDGVVPVGEDEGREMVQSFRDQIGFDEGFVDGAGGGDLDYNNTSTAASSIGHNSLLLRQVSLSSMETAGVTESTMIDISSSHGMTSNGIIEVFSGPPLQTPHQFSPMDREARVLRYREKKKTRKFQKIIRYASRKAYAETRPRIKGRFAKRTEVEHEGDQMFDAPVMVDTGYGVVPSY